MFLPFNGIFINVKPGKIETTCKNLCLNMNDIITT